MLEWMDLDLSYLSGFHFLVAFLTESVLQTYITKVRISSRVNHASRELATAATTREIAFDDAAVASRELAAAATLVKSLLILLLQPLMNSPSRALSLLPIPPLPTTSPFVWRRRL